MNLTPELIAKILAGEQVGGVNQRAYRDPNDNMRAYLAVADPTYSGMGDAQAPDYNNLGPWRFEQNLGDSTYQMYDASGNPTTSGHYDNSWKDFLTALAVASPAIAGVAGAGAAGAGQAGAGMTNGAFLGEGVASGVGAWDAAALKSALASGELGTAASYAGQNLANGTMSDTLGSMANGANTAANTANAATNAVGKGLNVGGLLGAAAGALSSKDQEKTTSVEPWGPAKPYLEGLLREGAGLYQQYEDQPFNGAQKAGYNNMAGLLDLVNKNAPGLLSGFQANASGANQFSRADPRRGLLGSTFNPSPAEWNPQSYGRFGG